MGPPLQCYWLNGEMTFIFSLLRWNFCSHYNYFKCFLRGHFFLVVQGILCILLYSVFLSKQRLKKPHTMLQAARKPQRLASVELATNKTIIRHMFGFGFDFTITIHWSHAHNVWSNNLVLPQLARLCKRGLEHSRNKFSGFICVLIVLNKQILSFLSSGNSRYKNLIHILIWSVQKG